MLQNLFTLILELLFFLLVGLAALYTIGKIQPHRLPKKSAKNLPTKPTFNDKKLSQKSVEASKTQNQTPSQALVKPIVELTKQNVTEKPIAPENSQATLAQLIANETHNDSQVRQAVASELGKILGGQQVRSETHKAIASLGKLSRDPDSSVRQAAVIALGEIASAKTLPYLKVALRDFDSDVVKSASVAIDRFKSYRVSGAIAKPSMKKKSKKIG
jgi:hypothetical protein